MCATDTQDLAVLVGARDLVGAVLYQRVQLLRKQAIEYPAVQGSAEERALATHDGETAAAQADQLTGAFAALTAIAERHAQADSRKEDVHPATDTCPDV